MDRLGRVLNQREWGFLRWVGYFVPSEPQTCKKQIPALSAFWFSISLIYAHFLQYFGFFWLFGDDGGGIYNKLGQSHIFLLSSLIGEYVSRRKVEWQPCFRYMVDSHGLCYSLKLLYTFMHECNCTSCSLDNPTSPTQFGPFLCWKFVKSTVHKVVVSSVNYRGSFLALCQKVSSLNMTISPPPPAPFVVVLEHIWKLKSPSKSFHFIHLHSFHNGWMKWSPTNGIIHFCLNPKLCSHLKLTLHLKVYQKKQPPRRSPC